MPHESPIKNNKQNIYYIWYPPCNQQLAPENRPSTQKECLVFQSNVIHFTHGYLYIFIYIYKYICICYSFREAFKQSFPNGPKKPNGDLIPPKTRIHPFAAIAERACSSRCEHHSGLPDQCKLKLQEVLGYRNLVSHFRKKTTSTCRDFYKERISYRFNRLPIRKKGGTTNLEEVGTLKVELLGSES